VLETSSKREEEMIVIGKIVNSADVETRRRPNATRAQVKWMFTTEKARAKMGRAYPEPASIKAHPTKESLSLCNGTSGFPVNHRNVTKTSIIRCICIQIIGPSDVGGGSHFR
jgi:hypothetical protein